MTNRGVFLTFMFPRLIGCENFCGHFVLLKAVWALPRAGLASTLRYFREVENSVPMEFACKLLWASSVCFCKVPRAAFYIRRFLNHL